MSPSRRRPQRYACSPALLRIRLDGDQEACGAVLRELVLRGVPVTDFHRAPMNLEKVFMEVTQDDA